MFWNSCAKDTKKPNIKGIWLELGANKLNFFSNHGAQYLSKIRQPKQIKIFIHIITWCDWSWAHEIMPVYVFEYKNQCCPEVQFGLELWSYATRTCVPFPESESGSHSQDTGQRKHAHQIRKLRLRKWLFSTYLQSPQQTIFWDFSTCHPEQVPRSANE